MRQTATKALARSYFYRDFLPRRLSTAELQTGEYLVLLGDSDLELSMLRELEVSGCNIHSVEKDRGLYLKQVRFNRSRLEPVHVYNKSLEDLVAEQLHSNKRLVVLNLDIYGSYLGAIDPVMSQILRFARRNVRTAIATYTNIGRDRPQLLEGLKSLAVCLWLSPEATTTTVGRLFARYLAAGMKPDAAFKTVLRHMFWIRSHLEHVVLSAVNVGTVKGDVAAAFLKQLEDCWQDVSATVQSPLTYGALVRAVSLMAPASNMPKVFDLSIQEVELVTYAAAGSYYHHGWYTVYGNITPVGPQKWLTSALAAVTANPVLFADHGAERLVSYNNENGIKLDFEVIWRGSGIGSAGRQLAIPATSPGLKVVDKELTSQAEFMVQASDDAVLVDPRPLIRDLASQGLMTDEVMSRLPAGVKIDRRSVTAIIARSNGERARRQQSSQKRK